MKDTNKSKDNSWIGNPIRWKGFIAVAIVFSVVIGYFVFLFDGHLKSLLEKAATGINGARVDIATLKTSFLRSDLEITKIEITNKKSPMKNLIEIGHVHYQFLFRPLLKKQFVIRDARMEGILYDTPRSFTGAIPEPPPKPHSPGIFDKLKGHLTQVVEAQVKQTSLSQFQGLFSSHDIKGEIKKLGESSQSYQKFKEIEGLSKTAEEQWQQIPAQLPNEQKINSLKERLETLAKSHPKSPEEIVAILEEIKKIRQEINDEVLKVNTIKTNVTQQVKQISDQIGQMDEIIKADIASVRNNLKIPSLDFKDITPALLGPKFSGYLTQGMGAVEWIRKNMPKKTEEEKIIKQQRARGVDIHFVADRDYPTFLLEHAVLQSSATFNGAQGSLTGEIRGLNTNPPLYGKPTLFSLMGDFPAAGLSGMGARILIDHTKEEGQEQFELHVDRFPITAMQISDSSDFGLSIVKATGKFKTDLSFREGAVHGTLSAVLAGVEYESHLPNERIDQIVKNILSKIPTFEVNARFSGLSDDLEFHVESDLGRKVADGLKLEFQAQIAALNEEINLRVREEIEGRKKELLARFEVEKKKALAPLEDKIKQVDAIVKRAQNVEGELTALKDKMIEQFKNEQKEKLKAVEDEQKQKLLEKAKKSIKLPF